MTDQTPSASRQGKLEANHKDPDCLNGLAGRPGPSGR
ncbi:hypothetical protein JMJ77_0005269 [Colletotrichum scovillei]|uniref:Uncharacterized protein n=1 Tax=Colletotrichum scovillei TaxID=1209932 RepID=A0A9P7RJ50_9PEZI|nr:hypothetical protein JMJ77_0005269 [Colletotrichum scovillei]KAG7076494.1 hypothetical protein JMJ76_0013757 [Colletotrichum scovillei]KAG7083540.1 hypothetical protein JMJ78_0008985 [Colletotrichum scovillei]